MDWLTILATVIPGAIKLIAELVEATGKSEAECNALVSEKMEKLLAAPTPTMRAEATNITIDAERKGQTAIASTFTAHLRAAWLEVDRELRLAFNLPASATA